MYLYHCYCYLFDSIFITLDLILKNYLNRYVAKLFCTLV